jgi:pyruvate kinase
MKKKKILKIQAIIKEIESLIKLAKKKTKYCKKQLKSIHPDLQISAKNILHYKAIRSQDMRKLHQKLAELGLSRIAKAQSNVMFSLLTTRAILKGMITTGKIDLPRHPLSIRRGDQLIKQNAKKLFGYQSKGRQTRIMVTMPNTAAKEYQLVHDLIDKGMNCARINCAHDTPEVWLAIIKNIRKASIKLGKKCKVAMDLAGPKIRTGQLKNEAGIVKFRPKKDKKGRIVQPITAWLGVNPPANSAIQHIPISKEAIDKLKEGSVLFFRDTRDKKRELVVGKKEEDRFLVDGIKTFYLTSGIQLYTNLKKKEGGIRVLDFPSVAAPILLSSRDILRLDKAFMPGESALYDMAGKIKELAHISCTSIAVFDSVKEGDAILFDDGKIEGSINAINKDHLLVKIGQTKAREVQLKADKGINFPDTKLQVNGLTAKDKKDLEFVVAHTDIINMSFVNKAMDVKDLFVELKALKANKKIGIVLKIETKSGFNNLPAILLEAMKMPKVGVMIARGDLAIEVGWKNIARIQSEIMALCQAGHIPVIWATQVLETLAKKGIPSRAEITDVSMSQRAECVMLNKGPYITQAVELLDTILRNLETYQEKNAPIWPSFEPFI